MPETPPCPLRPAPMQRWFRPLQGLVRGLFLLLGPLKVEGWERMPREGGLLVLANHLADVDPFAILARSPRPIRFMGKRELFDMGVVGFFMRAWGNFPVSRGEADRGALKEAAEILRAGEAVGIFPEGELSESGTLQELKGGVALIVRMAPCRVVCVALSGTERILPYGKLWPRPSFRRVRVRWGEPRAFDKATAQEMMSWAEGELRRLGAP